MRFTRVRYSLAETMLQRFSPGRPMKPGRPAPVATYTASNPRSKSSVRPYSLPTMLLSSNLTPRCRRLPVSASTIALGRRNSGMPYTSTPPGLCSASKMVTLWPLTAMSAAMIRPAGPLPTTAMRQPVFAARVGSVTWSVSRSKSAANRSSAPIASGSPLLPSRQSFSHWSSCGQTRPQMAGSAFFSRMQPGRAGEVARGHQLDEPRDVDLDRAAVDAGRLLALQAPARLGDRQLAVVAVADLLEVADAQAGVLLRLLLPRRARRGSWRASAWARRASGSPRACSTTAAPRACAARRRW